MTTMTTSNDSIPDPGTVRGHRAPIVRIVCAGCSHVAASKYISVAYANAFRHADETGHTMPRLGIVQQ